MIDSNLILIEGMAGSGKSTTGQNLFELLTGKKTKTIFYHEFINNHPIIDYGEPDMFCWIDQTIRRWENLVTEIHNQNNITIMDAAFFQCTLGELLERGAKEIEIYKYALEILDIITPVHPALIYFFQNDIVSSLKNVYTSRSQKWQNKVCTFLDDTKFGQHNNQSGYELYLIFNKVLRQITDDIFEQATIKKIAIENSEPNWSTINRTINNFLQIE